REEVTKDPIDEPRRRRAFALDLFERDLELVQRIVARLVDARRLARRSEEEPTEEIRQRRMIEEVAEGAPEGGGTAQDRAVRGRLAAEREVVAASAADDATIERVLLRAQLRVVAHRVERVVDRDELAERRRRVDVHLDHARIGRDRERAEPRIVRRRVA